MSVGGAFTVQFLFAQAENVSPVKQINLKY